MIPISAEIGIMMRDHEAVYRALLDDDIDKAAAALEAHLRRSLAPCLDMLAQLPPIPDNIRPPYLILAD